MIQSTPVMPQTLPAGDHPLAVRPLGHTRMVSTTSRARPAPPRRRRRRSRPERFAPLAAVALLALGVGVYVGAKHEPAAASVARDWAAAWERGDYASMHALLSDDARKRASLKRFVRTYREAGETVTMRKVATDNPRAADDGAYDLPVAVQTRIFGRLRGTVRLPMVEQKDGTAAVDWRAQLVFPGLRAGEKLTRETTLPNRGDILARDGTPLAKGPDRLSDLGPLAAEVAGRVGPAPPERADELARRGVPEGAPVGLNGLEREFDERLAGSPGGILRAGTRVVARAKARDGVDVKSAIDPDIQRAAVEALAGRFGGIAVLRPSTGEVLGLSGIAFSAPQPPGSTFKIITLAAALEAGKVKPNASFPVQTETQLEGVKIQNAHGEACGGSLKNSFADVLQLRVRPAGREGGRQAARGDGGEVRLQPGAGSARRRALDDPGGERDRRRPRGRLVGDRPGQGPRHPARARHRGGDHRAARPPRRADALARRAGQGDARRQRAQRTRDRALHARGGDGRHRHRRGGPRRQGRGQDRHRRAAQHRQRGPGPARARGRADRRSPRRTRPTPTRGSSASRPTRNPRVAVAVLLVGQGAGGETAAPAAKTVIEAAVKD